MIEDEAKGLGDAVLLTGSVAPTPSAYTISLVLNFLSVSQPSYLDLQVISSLSLRMK